MKEINMQPAVDAMNDAAFGRDDKTIANGWNNIGKVRDDLEEKLSSLLKTYKGKKLNVKIGGLFVYRVDRIGLTMVPGAQIPDSEDDDMALTMTFFRCDVPIASYTMKVPDNTILQIEVIGLLLRIALKDDESKWMSIGREYSTEEIRKQLDGGGMNNDN